MNLLGIVGSLHDEEAVVRRRWQETTTAWTDAQCRRFEGSHVDPLLAELSRYAGALDRLGGAGRDILRELAL